MSSFRSLRSVNTAVQLNFVLDNVAVVAVTYGNVEHNILLENVTVVTLTLIMFNSIFYLTMSLLWL